MIPKTIKSRESRTTLTLSDLYASGQNTDHGHLVCTYNTLLITGTKYGFRNAHDAA